jgi:hypothetical protein
MPMEDVQKVIPVEANEILEKIQKREPILSDKYNNVIIEGDLDLSNLNLPQQRIERTEDLRAIDLPNEGKLVSSRIEIFDCRINGNLNFSNCIFLYPIIFNRSQFKGKVNFSRSQFKEKADFSGSKFGQSADFSQSEFSRYASFSGSVFSENADFKQSQFRGIVSFIESQFKGNANFAGSRLSENSSFNGSHFGKDVYFNKSQFSKYSSFIMSIFSGEAKFSDSLFEAGVSFFDSKFGNDAYFSLSRFNGSSSFAESQFHKIVYFTQSIFNGDADFSQSEFNDYADFRESRFNGDAKFLYSKFIGEFGFNKARFYQIVNFHGSKFNKKIRLKDVDFNKIHIDWQGIKTIYRDFDGRVYLALIEDYKERGFFEDADDCYYNYRIDCRQNMKAPKKQIDWLLWKSYGYGMKPAYPLCWLVILFLVSFIFYSTLFWEVVGNSIWAVSNTSLTVFLSATKLIEDPNHPSSWMLYWAFTAEKLLASILFGLFLISFGRTMIR